MSVTVDIDGLTLCHQGSNGIATATMPDLCYTPSPTGPIPLPYPNIAMSSDLAQGTTTVEADGGCMCANYGSQFSMSSGDEPGVNGGVTSGTFMKEATWLTFSFDVKLEGSGACRLTDKMFMNHNNTVCCAGLFQKFLSAAGGDAAKACAALWARILVIIGEGVTGKVDGIRGLWERFQQNTSGGGGPSDPPDRGPNPQQKLYPNGSNTWQRHDEEIANQQKNLEDHLDEFEDNCGGPTPETQKAREWVTQKRPQPSDWSPQTAIDPEPATNYAWAWVAGAAAVFIVGLALTPVTGGASAGAATAAAAVMLGIGLSGGSGSSGGSSTSA
jgi:Domain of unknown function (DUF4150)